ncbi:WD40-repeat-containing domain protein [Cladochytrium replicatum]|nr:WD40-repeat-containing domain protein [Cladochytrium replicatum]
MHSKHNRAPFMRYIRNERTSSLIICDGRDLSVRHERRDEDDGPLAFQFYLRGRQTNTVVAFSIHHDGLIACPESTNLHIWNLNDEKLVMGDSLSPKFYLAENLGLLSAIEATTFLDANTVCIATASSILLWDLRTNGVASRVQYIPKRGSKVVCMDSTNASHWKRCSLLTGDTNGTICQWDLRKSAVAHTFQQPTEVTTLQYSPDGKHFISGGKDGVVGLWKSIEQQPIMIHDMHGELPIVDAAWKDDSVIASLSADSATSRSIITIWRPTIFMLPPE